MPDADTQGTTGGATGTAAAAAGTGGAIFVPEQLKLQHPELIEMLMASESMNDGERQYWVEILPVMTPEQVQQLFQILKNERDQLAAIDAKYGKQIEEIAARQRPVEELDEQRRAKASKRTAKEQSAREDEAKAAEELLRKLDE